MQKKTEKVIMMMTVAALVAAAAADDDGDDYDDDDMKTNINKDKKNMKRKTEKDNSGHHEGQNLGNERRKRADVQRSRLLFLSPHSNGASLELNSPNSNTHPIEKFIIPANDVAKIRHTTRYNDCLHRVQLTPEYVFAACFFHQ